jgi:glycosyltransferase involved in cell wall biosynthesis
MTPLVSVVMPVRNGGALLRAAVESILDQTLRDLELIVVDDGSTDGSRDVIKSLDDPRIRLVEQEPLGLVAALNRGLAEAKGAYVARMDADDLSLPERLERQAAFLAAHPEVGLVATSFRIVETGQEQQRTTLLPTRSSDLRMRLLLRNPFSHGSIMVPRPVLERAGPYSDAYGNNEDYDLWRRIARDHELAALPEVLYAYREHEAGVSKVTAPVRVPDRERLRDEVWAELAGRYRLRSVLAGVRHYRSEGTAEGRVRAADLLDDQWALAREGLLRRRPWLAVRALLLAALLRPRGPRRLLRRLRSLRT